MLSFASPPHPCSNYGIVNLADDMYTILTGPMSTFHAGAAGWHASGLAPCASPTNNFTTVPLNSFYSAARDDHFVTTTDCYECYDLYVSLGAVGQVYANCVPGAYPLLTYYNGDYQDNALLMAQPGLDGYSYVRIEGYALPAAAALEDGSMPHGTLNTEALWSFLRSNASHADYWAVGGQAGFSNATAQGYTSLGQMATVFTLA